MMRTLAVTALLTVLGTGSAAAAEPSLDIQKWARDYDAAFTGKDLGRLASFYHPDVTIYEGGSINVGWADYRDNHLGPELEEMASPRLTHSNVQLHPLDAGGSAAYVTSEYRLQARMKDRDIDAGGLETLVLVRSAGGRYLIRHSHTSSRRRPASPSPAPAPSNP
jgi:ketosteroid isomerase-like protein